MERARSQAFLSQAGRGWEGGQDATRDLGTSCMPLDMMPYNMMLY